jgi:hypothetical protein
MKIIVKFTYIGITNNKSYLLFLEMSMFSEVKCAEPPPKSGHKKEEQKIKEHCKTYFCNAPLCNL